MKTNTQEELREEMDFHFKEGEVVGEVRLLKEQKETLDLLTEMFNSTPEQIASFYLLNNIGMIEAEYKKELEAYKKNKEALLMEAK